MNEVGRRAKPIALALLERLAGPALTAPLPWRAILAELTPGHPPHRGEEPRRAGRRRAALARTLLDGERRGDGAGHAPGGAPPLPGRPPARRAAAAGRARGRAAPRSPCWPRRRRRRRRRPPAALPRHRDHRARRRHRHLRLPGRRRLLRRRRVRGAAVLHARPRRGAGAARRPRGAVPAVRRRRRPTTGPASTCRCSRRASCSAAAACPTTSSTWTCSAAARAALERAPRRLPARRRSSSTCSALLARRRPAGRADPARLLRVPARASGRTSCRACSSTTAHDILSLVALIGWFAARWPRAPTPSSIRKSWPASAGCWEPRTRSGASACYRAGARRRPAGALRASACCCGSPGREKRARAGTRRARSGRRRPARPAGSTRGRGRSWPRSTSIAAAISRRRSRSWSRPWRSPGATGASARVLAAFEHRLDRLGRRLERVVAVSGARQPA